MSGPSGTTWKRKKNPLCEQDLTGGGEQTFSGTGSKENNYFLFFCRFEVRDLAAYLWIGQGVVIFAEKIS